MSVLFHIATRRAWESAGSAGTYTMGSRHDDDVILLHRSRARRGRPTPDSPVAPT